MHTLKGTVKLSVPFTDTASTIVSIADIIIDFIANSSMPLAPKNIETSINVIKNIVIEPATDFVVFPTLKVLLSMALPTTPASPSPYPITKIGTKPTSGLFITPNVNAEIMNNEIA